PALASLLAEAEERAHLALVLIEEGLVQLDVRPLEVVRRPLPLGALEDLAVTHAGRPLEVVDVVHVLQVHGDALEPVRELAADGLAVDASALLEIGELADLEPVEPDLPAETPRPERRGLPIILDETDVVLRRVGADGPGRAVVDALALSRGVVGDD